MVRMLRIAGIDVGTGFTKAVVIGVASADGQTPAAEGAPEILGRASLRTGVEMEKAAREALAAALEAAGQRDAEVRYVAATGFGRHAVSFRDIQITEITSSARGARFLYPHATCVLDIGSQTTRAITLTETGRVNQFKSNDKCAAGSGSFIARAVKYLEIPLEQAGEKALDADKPQAISSICAVLAESEIINHVSAGVSLENILAGIYESLADRAGMLLKRTGMGKDLVFIGGVARQRGMLRALENRLKVTVYVPENADYVCALGAALLGLQRLRATEKARRTETAGNSAAVAV
jgi:predicted CoA-substrate-specific enzyme activase